MGGLIGKSPFYVFTTVLLERIFDVLITLILLIITIPLLASVQNKVQKYAFLPFTAGFYGRMTG